MIAEVPNHPNYYISDQGVVFRKTKDGLRKLKPSFVGPYAVVQLNRQTCYVHSLVATMFVDNDDQNRSLIFHIDGNYENNSAENLIWLTRKEIGVCQSWLVSTRKKYLRERAKYHEIC